MSARGITRRSLLLAGAGTLAGGLVPPAAVLGALAQDALAQDPAPRLSERWIGDLAAGAPKTLVLDQPADLVGLSWSAPANAAVMMRVGVGVGAYSPWVSAAAHGHAPEAPVQAARQVGDPVWTGGTLRLQLRSPVSLTGVRVHLVDVSAGQGARRRALARRWLASAAALPLAGPPLAAAVAQPPIIARRAWAGRVSPPAVAPEYGGVRMAFVHHTENPNGYLAGEVPAMLRAIYAFHRYVHGWNDIGYNFVIDLYGRVFEARAGGVSEPVVGAQAGGYNKVSTGVAVLGSFMSTPISAAARSALQALLAWKLSLHGVPSQGRVLVRVNPAGASYSRFPANARVSLPRIAGHRDGDSTDCPGDVLYGQLPAIRHAVAALAPRPARLTIAASATIGGQLAFLDGTPIVGAQVLVQARSVSARGEAVLEQTLAEAITDAAGAWSLPAPPSAPAGGLWLRALAPAATAGATISEPVHLAATAAPPGPPTPGPPTPGTPPTVPSTTPGGAPSSTPAAQGPEAAGGASAASRRARLSTPPARAPSS